MAGIAFTKGHGTENDFVLIPDPEDRLTLDEELVRSICDRRAGIGADGVIRVVPASGDAVADGARWFMDYRNADGSLAEMCGNGARVFARYLVHRGWEAPGAFEFGTRGGVRSAVVPEPGTFGEVSIGMGPVTLGPESWTDLAGRHWSGRAVDVGNPHLACFVDGTAGDLGELDLTRGPVFDPAVFPAGVNVEIVVPAAAGPDGVEGVRMRVHERGVGETRSCGTGTVAVAAARLAALGRTSGTVDVHVPGGQVRVDLATGDGRVFPESVLTGPAVLVATGVLQF
ncbi:diaminopimelate epimerase [Nakamurella sp. YIM 132087]|uniref:Diaminopimelate epimerase n=1 Tax=Nakamurella alba TaxID=2665158 RepID=A0A7K1FTP6_9ACTN|nr:diaminopimelate epimerase [Nakamurella alba]